MNTVATFPRPNDSHKWLRRAGRIGFWFFFVKGLLWLAAPLVLYYLA